jgi:hypothetical protein
MESFLNSLFLRQLALVVASIVILLPIYSSALSNIPPNITIDEYALADNFLAWNTNLSMIPLGESSNGTVIVVPSTIRGLSLLCNASYPIEWTFHRDKWNQRTNWQTILVNSRGSDPKNLEALW